MKKTLLLSTALLISLSSCSLFETKVKTEAVMPADRLAVATASAPLPYHSETLDKGILSGDWVIDSVAGIKPQGDEVAFIKFDASTHYIYANNGCNSINGNYAVNPGDSTLSFSNIISTMRYCQIPDQSDIKIDQALATTSRYTWHFDANKYIVRTYNAAGNHLLTLTHQDYDFLNGSWSVKQINGRSQNNPDMKLVFDLGEMKIHGNTGCNILNGSIVVDMSESNSLSFQQIATTRRACPDFDLETALTVALENTVFVRPVNQDSVELLSGSHKVIMLLSRD